MKPVKSLAPLASWLMRLALLLMVGVLIWPALRYFQFTNLISLITAALGLFALLLFVGGFFSRHTLTMLSGLAILGISGWFVYRHLPGVNLNLAAYALTAIIGLHFFVNGNK